MFKAEKYDAQAWAKLFKDAGAKFVVPVAEHHDGFQMYESDLCKWNAAEMGPKRDVVGELAEAVRAEDMVFGVSSHRAEHWWFMNGGNHFPSDVQDPEYADFYGPAKGQGRPTEQYFDNAPDEAYLNDWLLRTCEIIDKYEPKLIWFDWWIQNMAFKPYLKKFAAYYYNASAKWGTGVRRQLQVRRLPRRHGRLRHRARPGAPHPWPLLAERHLGLQELLGLHRRP